MAVLCLAPTLEKTLEETLLQVCAEVCTSCPTLNAAQVAGCGTAFLVLVGTLLGPPPTVVGVGMSDFDRKRRHPDFPPEKKKKAERKTLPAYPGLRAVYTPAITPVVRSRSTAAGASWRAMMNEKAFDEPLFTLEEMPRVGQHALRRRITGEHDQILMSLLAGTVGLLLLGEIVHKALGRIGARTNEAKMRTLEENRSKLERIFHTPTQLVTIS